MKAANFQKKNSAKWRKDLAETEDEAVPEDKAANVDNAAVEAETLKPPEKPIFKGCDSIESQLFLRQNKGPIAIVAQASCL